MSLTEDQVSTIVNDPALRRLGNQTHRLKGIERRLQAAIDSGIPVRQEQKDRLAALLLAIPSIEGRKK